MGKTSLNEATPDDWDRLATMSKEPDKEQDMVSAPAHYNMGDVECIDGIRAALSPEAFKGYLHGNTMKYLWRAFSKHDDPTEDCRKAQWYLTRLIDEVTRIR